jgi:hypothetical protein
MVITFLLAEGDINAIPVGLHCIHHARSYFLGTSECAP